MPGAEQQPPPARVQPFARIACFRSSRCSNAKNPDGAGCGVYIERLARRCQRLLCTAQHCVRRTRKPAWRLMRPLVLNPLFASLTTLPGVGPKLEKLYAPAARPRGRRASSICCSICRPAPSTAARGRSCATSCPARVVTVAVTVDRHRAAAAAPLARALSDLCQRRHRRPHAHLFQRRARTTSKSSCRSASCATSPAPPRSTTACCRWCIPTAWWTRQTSPSCRWSSRSIRSPKGSGAQQGAQGDRRARSRKLPDLPEWQDAAWLRARAFPAFADALQHSAPAGRAARRRCRKARPGRGSPMTNCSPASSRWRWCARIMRRPAGRGSAGDGRLRAQDRSRRCPIRSRRRSSARSTTSSPISRSPQRMLRLLQGDVGSGKTVVALLAAATVIEAGRQAALMAPTEILARQHLDDHRAARGGRRHPRRDPHRPRARRASASEILDRLALGEIDLLVGTHALFQDEVAFHDLALADRRRAAPLRRASAARAGAQGRSGRRAGADRDADPAHAGADLFRRHGHLRAAREAGRPPADRHPHHPARPRSTRWSTRSAARSTKASASTGSARWSRNPKRSISPPPRSASRSCSKRFGDARRSRARPHEGRRQGRAPWRASPPARRGSWSPPR